MVEGEEDKWVLKKETYVQYTVKPVYQEIIAKRRGVKHNFFEKI